MESRNVSIIGSIGEGYAALRNHAGLVILGLLLYLVVAGLGSALPFVKYIFPIFLMAPLQVGLMLFILNVAHDRQPSVDDLFKGFGFYWKSMGVYWLLALIYLMFAAVASAPLLLFVLLQLRSGLATAQGYNALFHPQAPGLLAITVILFVAVIFIMIRWAFVFFVIADNPWGETVTGAFRRSAEITKGYRFMMFMASIFFSVALSLFLVAMIRILGLPGIVLSVLILCFVIPLVLCTMGALYIQLKRQADGEESVTRRVSGSRLGNGRRRDSAAAGRPRNSPIFNLIHGTSPDRPGRGQLRIA